MSNEGLGEIRYEINDGKALFSVNANLPTSNGEIYRLWVKTAEADSFRDAGVLELNKGGLIATSNVSSDDLPATIEIRRGSEVVLTGVIPAAN